MLEKSAEECAQLELESSHQGFSTGGPSSLRWLKRKKKKKIGISVVLNTADRGWIRVS